jgi:hypothetical protein
MNSKLMSAIRGQIGRATLSALAIGVLAVTSAPSARAVPTITISDGIKRDTVTLNNASGVLSFNGSVGKFNLSLGTSAASGLQMLPTLNLNSLTYGTRGSGSLTISLSDTSVHPNDGSISSQISGQSSGSVSYSTFADKNNALFGNGLLLSSKGALGGNFNAGGSGVVTTGNPFSLTETFVIQLSKGGSTQFHATVTDPPNGAIAVAPVSETGSTMAFLGLALLGLEVARRRLAVA